MKDDVEKFDIWLVWGRTLEPGGIKISLHAVTTSEAKAKLYSEMMRRDMKEVINVLIEKTTANHLYGWSMVKATDKGAYEV